VEYLGDIITDKSVEPNPEKKGCIKEHPTPKNVVEIKQFLGLSGYYQRFIENYNKIIKLKWRAHRPVHLVRALQYPYSDLNWLE